MKKSIKPKSDMFFEISWEVCNKVGGIFTVLSSKAIQMQKYYKDDYYLIGPYFSEASKAVFKEDSIPEDCKEPYEELKKKGITCHFGTWLVKGEPKVILLDCKDNMRVLDACAAPGGKTGHILESAKNLDVIAVDSSEVRLERVTQNLQRLKLKAKLIASDALDTEYYAKDKQFDRILLDAPCSATGVIRRHPDIKVLRRKSDIKELQQLQSKMLDALWEKLKPEGILVYATCSILPQEKVYSRHLKFAFS